MAEAENKAVVRRFFDEVWNGGRIDVIDEIITPDAVDHNPNPGQPPGSEGVKWLVRVFSSAFPDMHFDLQDQVAEGDKVVSRWVLSGTQQGELFGIPATGKRISITGIDIVSVIGGKMTEHWVSIDQLGMLQQLGVVPAPGQS
jgi:predicted ester cyclase